jgi:hypothetical protein
LKNLVPILSAKIIKGELKCIKELEGSASGSCMTAPAKRSTEQVKKLQYLLPSFAN